MIFISLPNFKMANLPIPFSPWIIRCFFGVVFISSFSRVFLFGVAGFIQLSSITPILIPHPLSSIIIFESLVLKISFFFSSKPKSTKRTFAHSASASYEFLMSSANAICSFLMSCSPSMVSKRAYGRIFRVLSISTYFFIIITYSFG